MPYPITPRVLSKLSKQQRAAYDRAKRHEHPRLKAVVVDRMADARLYYRSVHGEVPPYMTKIQVRGEFDDGTTYTEFYVVVPREQSFEEIERTSTDTLQAR